MCKISQTYFKIVFLCQLAKSETQNQPVRREIKKNYKLQLRVYCTNLIVGDSKRSQEFVYGVNWIK
jgi:hypothetical protein